MLSAGNVEAAEVVTIKFILTPSEASAVIECQKLAAQMGSVEAGHRQRLINNCASGGIMRSDDIVQANGDVFYNAICYVVAREPAGPDDVQGLVNFGHEVLHCIRGHYHGH